MLHYTWVTFQANYVTSELKHSSSFLLLWCYTKRRIYHYIPIKLCYKWIAFLANYVLIELHSYQIMLQVNCIELANYVSTELHSYQIMLQLTIELHSYQIMLQVNCIPCKLCVKCVHFFKRVNYVIWLCTTCLSEWCLIEPQMNLF